MTDVPFSQEEEVILRLPGYDAACGSAPLLDNSPSVGLGQFAQAMWFVYVKKNIPSDDEEENSNARKRPRLNAHNRYQYFGCLLRTCDMTDPFTGFLLATAEDVRCIPKGHLTLYLTRLSLWVAVRPPGLPNIYEEAGAETLHHADPGLCTPAGVVHLCLATLTADWSKT